MVLVFVVCGSGEQNKSHYRLRGNLTNNRGSLARLERSSNATGRGTGMAF